MNDISPQARNEKESGTGLEPSPFASAAPALVSLMRFAATMPPPDDICHALRRNVPLDWNPGTVTLWLYDMNTRTVRIVGRSTLIPDSMYEQYGLLPIDTPVPVCEVVRSSAPLFFEVEGASKRWPLLAMAEAQAVRAGDREVGLYPLIFKGVTIGAVALHFPQPFGEHWFTHAYMDGASAVLSMFLQCWAEQAVTLETPTDKLNLGRSLHLSDREKTVLALVRDGCTNAQIASELNYSVSTVKQDIASVSALLGAADRKDLVARAIASGLIEDRRTGSRSD